MKHYRFLQFIELDVLLCLCDFVHDLPFALNAEFLRVFKRQLSDVFYKGAKMAMCVLEYARLH